MTTELPPFACSYSPGFSKLLHELNSSLAISTYQAGKLIFISPKNEQELVQLPRSFDKPMGLAFHQGRLAVASRNGVYLYSDSPGAAANYPKRPNTYDSLYIPRAVYFTGELDIHDIEYTSKGLLAVNTRFSCVSLINGDQSFREIWRPSFIKDLRPEDACHLNGMVLENEELSYLTALGETSEARGWRPKKAQGGILINARTQELILKNLPMPHSPRLYKEGLFMLLSATGELAKVDIVAGTYQVLQQFTGFVRGMDRIGDFLFIGLSKLRTTSASFGDLPIAKHSPYCGVVAYHLPTGKLVGHLKYETSVEEIFDVRILSGSRRPGILSIEKNEHEGVITVPEGVYWPMKK
jgi:uncharacterized protein (TIGR03032 family)